MHLRDEAVPEKWNTYGVYSCGHWGVYCDEHSRLNWERHNDVWRNSPATGLVRVDGCCEACGQSELSLIARGTCLGKGRETSCTG